MCIKNAQLSVKIVTLLAAISLKDMLMVALKPKSCS